MRRAIFILGAVLFVYFAGRAAFRALAADETKIRWLVEDMVEGYNTARPKLGVSPLRDDWHHEGYEVNKKLLQAGMFRVAMQDRDPQTKELISRVGVVPDSLAITIEEDRATIQLEALFERRRDGEWQERWRISIEAQLEDGDDGWEIVTSRHTDLKGTQLSR